MYTKVALNSFIIYYQPILTCTHILHSHTPGFYGFFKKKFKNKYEGLWSIGITSSSGQALVIAKGVPQIQVRNLAPNTAER